MESSRTTFGVLAASAAGLLAITVYLAVERSVATGIPLNVTTEQLLQWDASNAYGTAAFAGGWGLAAMGLLMDAVVSTCWALLFAMLYVAFPELRRHIFVSGLVYGAFVMSVMIFLVVPIGHAQQAPRTVTSLANILVAHTVFFGVPLALTMNAIARA